MVVDGMMPGLISLILGCGIMHSGVHMVAENGVALAKPNDLAIPHSIYGASIAVCILLPLAFRLRCLEVLFCGFGYVAFVTVAKRGIPVEARRNP